VLPLDPLLAVLLAVPVVMLACHAGGWAARRLGQPPVIGEMFVGILLGPSLLGWLAPGVMRHVLPQTALPVLSALGSLALLTFLFVTGLELDLRELRTVKGAAIGVSLSSIALPMILGGGLALYMHRWMAPAGVGRLPFTLFVAVALSITAFPVLARILADRNLDRTPLGTFVMACAAVDDAVAWCLLTVAIALQTSSEPYEALLVAGLTAVLVVVLLALRPALRAVLIRAERASDELVLVIICAGLLLTAYTTDRIGVHPALGAFLFGVTVPRGIPAAERGAQRIRAVFVALLLPLYFADIGLHTDLVDLGSGGWGWALLLLAAAVVGKFGGATVAARLGGSGWRWAASVGTLMNCRGVTELVVIGIGRQIGVVSPQLFATLVLMAVVTTTATGPLLSWLVAGRELSPVPRERRGGAPRDRPALAPTAAADRGRGGAPTPPPN
jgi:Kef-type K+ transport system membrane component KefB